MGSVALPVRLRAFFRKRVELLKFFEMWLKRSISKGLAKV